MAAPAGNGKRTARIVVRYSTELGGAVQGFFHGRAGFSTANSFAEFVGCSDRGGRIRKKA